MSSCRISMMNSHQPQSKQLIWESTAICWWWRNKFLNSLTSRLLPTKNGPSSIWTLVTEYQTEKRWNIARAQRQPKTIILYARKCLTKLHKIFIFFVFSLRLLRLVFMWCCRFSSSFFWVDTSQVKINFHNFWRVVDGWKNMCDFLNF